MTSFIIEEKTKMIFKVELKIELDIELRLRSLMF